MRILVIEDSNRLRESLRLGLKKCGYVVDVAADGEEGLTLGSKEPYDLVILDIGLPKRDGLAVVKGLRERGKTMDVLILSARDAVMDRIQGLDAGADDYLVKPFSFEELVARVRALARRHRDVRSDRVTVGDLSIDLSARTVERNSRRLDLSAREFMLLRLLASRIGQTVSRIEIEDKLYGLERFPNSNVVASTMSLLRAKLGEPELIHTRRGLGYVLEIPSR